MWQQPFALRHFNPVYVGLGSHPVIRRCRLNVRFAQKRTSMRDLAMSHKCHFRD
jgi:hypothetical protein